MTLRKEDDIFKTLTAITKMGFACFIQPVFHPAISCLETCVGQQWLPGTFCVFSIGCAQDVGLKDPDQT